MGLLVHGNNNAFQLDTVKSEYVAMFDILILHSDFIMPKFVSNTSTHINEQELSVLCILLFLKLTFPLSVPTCLIHLLTALQPHLRNVIEYMLQVNKDTDDEVALEACEFWYNLLWDVIFLMSNNYLNFIM